MPIDDIRLDHVAVAVPSIAGAHSRWVDELGGAPLHGGDSGAFEAHQFRFANEAKLELIQPSAFGTGGGFVGKFLSRRGAWVHHITFKVDDLAGAIDVLAENGLEAVDVDLTDDHWKEAFLRPSQVGRIVLQLAQSAFSDDDWSRFSGAPLPHPAPGAADLVGPLLVVESYPWAERLYGELLGGKPARDADERLVFSWPSSPLVVTCIEGDEPGPLSLLVDGWAGRLPHHPRLGPPVEPKS